MPIDDDDSAVVFDVEDGDSAAAKALNEDWANMDPVVDEDDSKEDYDEVTADDDVDDVDDSDDEEENPRRRRRRDIRLNDGDIDHIVIAAPNLERAIAQFSDICGVAPRVFGSVKGIGIRSARVALEHGGYLELIAPDDKNPGPIGRLIRDKGISDLTPFAFSIHQSNRDGLDKLYDDVENMSYVPDCLAMSFTSQKDGTPQKFRVLHLYGHKLGGICPYFIHWSDMEQHPSTTLPVVGKLKKLTVRAPSSDPIHDLLEHVHAANNTIVVEEGSPKLSFQFSSPEGTIKFAASTAVGYKFPGFPEDDDYGTTMNDERDNNKDTVDKNKWEYVLDDNSQGNLLDAGALVENVDPNEKENANENDPTGAADDVESNGVVNCQENENINASFPDSLQDMVGVGETKDSSEECTMNDEHLGEATPEVESDVESDIEDDEDDEEGSDCTGRMLNLEDGYIDHIVLATSNLKNGMEQFERMTGIKPKHSGSIKGVGIRSARVMFDEECFLEIIAPNQKEQGPIGQLIKDKHISDLVPFGFAIRTSRADDLCIEVGKLQYIPDHLTMISGKKGGSRQTWDVVHLYGHKLGGICPYMIQWPSTSRHPCATKIPIVGKLEMFALQAPKDDPVHELLKHLNVKNISIEIGSPLMSFHFGSPAGTVEFSAKLAVGYKFPGCDEEEQG